VRLAYEEMGVELIKLNMEDPQDFSALLSQLCLTPATPDNLERCGKLFRLLALVMLGGYTCTTTLYKPLWIPICKLLI